MTTHWTALTNDPTLEIKELPSSLTLKLLINTFSASRAVLAVTSALVSSLCLQSPVS